MSSDSALKSAGLVEAGRFLLPLSFSSPSLSFPANSGSVYTANVCASDHRAALTSVH